MCVVCVVCVVGVVGVAGAAVLVPPCFPSLLTTQESHQSCVEQVAPLASSVLIAAESKPMKANLQAPVNNSQYTKSSLPTFRSTSKPAGRPQVPPRLSRHLGIGTKTK